MAPFPDVSNRLTNPSARASFPNTSAFPFVEWHEIWIQTDAPVPAGQSVSRTIFLVATEAQEPDPSEYWSEPSPPAKWFGTVTFTIGEHNLTGETALDAQVRWTHYDRPEDCPAHSWLLAEGGSLRLQRPVELGVTRTIGLTAVTVAVDTNRDRMVGAGGDDTSRERPFIFWTNDDQDDEEHKEKHSPTVADSANGTIDTMRDLEDFARLHVSGLRLQDWPESTRVGFRWTGSTGNPGVKIYFAADEAEGSDDYLRDPAKAQEQISEAYARRVAIVYGSDVEWLLPEDAARIPRPGRWHTIFEGIAGREGKGRLDLVLEIAGAEIVVPGVWLELKHVRKMYERAKGTPYENPVGPPGADGVIPTSGFTPDPFDHTFAEPWWETKETIFLVHGIHDKFQSPSDAYRANMFVANTFFKRLWWSGFTGRFCFYKWPARTFQNFNESEWRAYVYGQGFAEFVRAQGSGRLNHIVAHSQGNAVVASAFKRHGLSTEPIATWVSMQGAIPANCAHDGWIDKPDGYNSRGADNPDLVADLGYRGWLQEASPGSPAVAAQFINFFNKKDWVTGDGLGWGANQKSGKPTIPSYFVVNKHVLHDHDQVSGSRRVTDLAESLAFGASATHQSLGQESRLDGLISGHVDIFAETGSENHATQWDDRIQGIKEKKVVGEEETHYYVLRLYELLLQKARIPTTYDSNLGPDRSP